MTTQQPARNKVLRVSIYLFCLVLLFSFISIAGLFAGRLYEKKLIRVLTANGLSYEEVKAEWNGVFRVKGLKGQDKESCISMNALEGTLSLDASEATIAIDGISYEAGTASVFMPEVKIKGISVADFLPDDINERRPFTQSLLNASIDEVTLAAVYIKQDNSETNNQLNFTSVTIRDMYEGKAGEVVTGAGKLTIAATDEVAVATEFLKLTFNFHHMNFEKFDLALFASGGAKAQSEPGDKLLYENGAFGNLSADLETLSVFSTVYNLGNMSSSRFYFKADPQSETDGKDAKATAYQSAGSLVRDIASRVSQFDLLMKDVTIDSKKDAKITIGDTDIIFANHAFDIAMRDANLQSERNSFQIGSVEVGQLRFIMDEVSRSWPISSWIPQIGSLKLRNVDADFVDETVLDGTKTTQVKGEKLDFSANYTDGLIPSKVIMSFDKVAIPAGSLGDTAFSNGISPEQYRQMGYDILVYDGHIELSWDKARKIFSIKDAHYGVQDMLEFNFSAVLGGVDEEVFSPTGLERMAAWSKSSVEELSFDAQLDQWWSRFFTYQAKQTNVSAEDLRRVTMLSFKFWATKFLEENPKGREVAQLIADWVEKGGKLGFSMKSQSPGMMRPFNYLADEKKLATFFANFDMSATLQAIKE